MHPAHRAWQGGFRAGRDAGYERSAMSDSAALSLIALLAAGLVALALAWPQGLGAPSPPPFGHALAPLPAAATPLAAKRSPAPAPAATGLRPAIHG
jgi:hypothetical protein